MAQARDNQDHPEQTETTLATLLCEHLQALRVKGYSPYTVRNRDVHIRFFLRWCQASGTTTLGEITAAVLESYQRYLFDYRKRDGQPLAVVSRHSCLVPLRVWFRWMVRQHYLEQDLAPEIELPRLGRSLPRNILSAPEAECVLAQPDIRSPVGLRDRAILELLYSTGIRRLELVNLKLRDLPLDRRLIFVREGKGKRDRYVPVGQRAIVWLRKYTREACTQLAGKSDSDTVFLTTQGHPLSRDHLTWIARKHVAGAKLGKGGACHLFRHSMATLMHENGADIRCIQQILGHADIKTTQIYTQVAIRTLQRVHAATHPEAR